MDLLTLKWCPLTPLMGLPTPLLGKMTPSQTGPEGPVPTPKRCRYKFDTFMVSPETPNAVMKTLERCHFDTFLVAPQDPKMDTQKGVC